MGPGPSAATRAALAALAVAADPLTTADAIDAAARPPARGAAKGRDRGRAAGEHEHRPRRRRDLRRRAVDLARSTQHWARGEALPASAVAQMTRSTTTVDGPDTPYGMGLELLPLDGRRRISHTGTIGGFSAAAWYPRNDLVLAVLTNFAFVPAEAIERDLDRAVRGLPAPQYHDLPVAAELRRRVAGQWEIGAPGFVIEVAETNGRLRVRMPPPGWSGDLRDPGGGRFVSVRAPGVESLQLVETDPPTTLLIGMGDLRWDAPRAGGGK